MFMLGKTGGAVCRGAADFPVGADDRISRSASVGAESFGSPRGHVPRTLNVMTRTSPLIRLFDPKRIARPPIGGECQRQSAWMPVSTGRTLRSPQSWGDVRFWSIRDPR